MITRTSAIIPASATNASSNELNIRVANVENPNGEIRRVMGSSFIVDKITKPAAAPKPGAIKGSSILKSLEVLCAPNVLPASLKRCGTAATATRTIPIARDPKRTTYEKTSSAFVLFKISYAQSVRNVQNLIDKATKSPGSAKVAITTACENVPRREHVCKYENVRKCESVKMRKCMKRR